MIMEKKMKEQDLGATEQAKAVAISVLSRARNRPNFGNGGEVENLLSKAKKQCLSRRAKLPLDQRPKFIVFEPQDFDKDFDRGKDALANLAKLFADVVGHEEIITKLAEYQRIAQTCRDMGREPRDMVPTNFVFTGPPGRYLCLDSDLCPYLTYHSSGTGKTTIARKIGQVYFDMGILSSADFIECSASDLVGQYVGQTGPKTQKIFEKALGKVLFIDEAYRLAGGGGSFNQEAVDEIVALLTHETYKGKVIVILAGYENEMRDLMQVNPGLSSRFPEWVPFSNIPTKDCMTIIVKRLHKEGVAATELVDQGSSVYQDMAAIIDSLATLHDWGNARDINTLADKIIRFALLNVKKPSENSMLVVKGEDVVRCATEMLQDRVSRAAVGPSARAAAKHGIPPVAVNTARPTPPPIDVGTSTQAAAPPPAPTRPPTPPRAETPQTGKAARGRGRGGRGGLEQRRDSVASTASSSDGLANVAVGTRDAGVSDEIWAELQEARRRAVELERTKQAEIAAISKRVDEAAKKAKQQKSIIQGLERKLAEPADDKLKQQWVKQKQAAEDRERRLKEERDRINNLVLRAAKLAEEERKRKEQLAQQKLRRMGVCVMGYQWINVGNGYRCAGGSHFVSSAQLGV